jgi:hypothetical protein
VHFAKWLLPTIVWLPGIAHDLIGEGFVAGGAEAGDLGLGREGGHPRDTAGRI